MKKLFFSFVMMLATAVSALALPTTDVNVVIDGDHGSSTIMLPFDYDDIPEGLHVYLFQGWDDDANAPILEEVYGFEKNTPYYITTDYEDGFEETFTGVRDAEYATYSYSYNGEDMCTGVYAPVEITDGWVLRVDEDGQWGFSKVRADEPFTVPANQVYFYKGPEGDDDEHDITYPAASWIGSWDIVSSAEVGSTVTATANFEVEGYHVESFTVNDGAVAVTKISNTQYSFVMPDEDVTIVAPFAINRYTVRFYEDDTKATEYTELSQEVDYNGHVTKPADEPTKSAHNFLYWAADGVEFDFENFTIEANTDIYATWEAVPAAKWTDSHGNEITELIGAYYSYVVVYPTITLHLEGAVNQEDGTHTFVNQGDDIINVSEYIVDNGQVSMDVNFQLKPDELVLFKNSAIPAITFRYTKNDLRDPEEAVFTPIIDETVWDWNAVAESENYDMKLDEETDPKVDDEYVLAILGEMPIDEEGGFNARALQVVSEKPCAKDENEYFMEASQVTFENLSAGKMTVVFSSAEDHDSPMYINVDGNMYDKKFQYQANIENRELTEDYDKDLGSMDESDKKTVTFYVNPGVHTIAGYYSGNVDHLVYLDEDGELQEGFYTAYFFADQDAYIERDPDQAIDAMDLVDYYKNQPIRIYSMHFEPIKYETSINDQYGWASLYHEHDLIVPEDAGLTYYYASSCDGNNVEIKEYDLQPQADYDGQVIAAETGLVFSGAAGTYVFYGATVGDPEELWKAGKWIAGPWNAQPKYEPLAENNLFLGVIEDKPCDPMQYYVLGNETTPEVAIFQKYNGSTLGAHKAYLDLNGAAASVRLVLPGTNPLPTDVQQNAADVKANKFLMDGKVIITRGARTYNVQGMILR